MRGTAGWRRLSCAFFLLSACARLFALPAAPTASPTPTPRPRLTGGFGRAPAATPIPTEDTGQSQSMADAVRSASEAKARREQKPGVAITNSTLVTDPNKGRLTLAAPARALSPTPARRNDRPGAPQVSPQLVPAPAEGEAEWRERARSSRVRVEELKAKVSQLESDAAGLERDFYRWDDGQYRDGVIKPSWDKKKEELEKTRAELTQAQKDLEDLPEKARKAGALPGWIRE